MSPTRERTACADGCGTVTNFMYRLPGGGMVVECRACGRTVVVPAESMPAVEMPRGWLMRAWRWLFGKVKP
ncbi:MAG TPA: hypothetical protein VHQ87_10295 [Rhizobacter sp.]|nr:hypothetical protein [Rhizobacter sp.]